MFSPSPVPFSDLSRAFGQNDIEDFEFHIARVARGWGGAEADDLLAFLRANPGKTTRDWKGKGPSVPSDPLPGEKPWHRLKLLEVREIATKAFARDLPKNVRQAAARDKTGLIWNPLARKYRHRLPSDPPVEGRGAGKVNRSASPGPAAVTRRNAKVQNAIEF